MNKPDRSIARRALATVCPHALTTFTAAFVLALPVQAQTADEWMQTARTAQADKDPVRARAALERALALDPTLASARIELLWLDLQGNNAAALRNNLERWAPEAEKNPGYWAMYALAHLKLGQFDAAERWYRQQVGQAPSDIAWQLSFAYELEQAGQSEKARQLRPDIAARMRLHAATIEAYPPEVRQVVMQAQANLARELEGPQASEAILRRMLDLGHRGAEVYELLVSATLAQQQYEQAQAWLEQARREGHHLPAYLELGVARGLQDREQVKRLLAERGEELSPSDRVAALRFVGQRAAALSLAEDRLPASTGSMREALERQRDEMRYEMTWRLNAALERKNLGFLDINRGGAQLDVPQAWGSLTLRGFQHRLQADIADAYFGLDARETDVSISAQLQQPAQTLQFTLGTNHRSGDALTYGGLSWTRAHNARWGSRLDVQANAVVEDTSALRALGKKHRVAYSMNTRFGASAYGRVELASQRFETRQGTSLGRGARMEFEAGTRVLDKWEQWLVRVSGSAERNRLASSLPASIKGVDVSPLLAVDSVVASRFSTLGVGTTWRFGNSDPLARQIHGYLDGWTGRQWPADERAYNARAVINLPVGRLSRLELEAYYSTVQSAFSSKPNRSFRISYQLPL